MRPLYLYMENFMSHEISEIDLSNINSALIIGKLNGSDLHSNGIGKSTIFTAIEYCLFNECPKGMNLEKLIRDDTNKCNVLFDFEEAGKIYRISRSRTKKGTSDLSLLERTSNADDDINPHFIHSNHADYKKYWNDISSRRAADTEENLFKLHKMSHKAYCSGYYFIQNDKGDGLANETKKGRKDILKGTFQLLIYDQLYKLANGRNSLLLKEIDKNKAVLLSIGDPSSSIIQIENSINSLITSIENQTIIANSCLERTSSLNLEILNLKNKSQNLLEQVGSLLNRKKDTSNRLSNIEASISNYSLKRKNIVVLAKALASEIENFKNQKLELEKNDFSSISKWKSDLEITKNNLAQKSAIIFSEEETIAQLQIPIPNEQFCKHCRQPLTDAHRNECKKSDDERIKRIQENLFELKNHKIFLTSKIDVYNKDIIKLEKLKKELDNVCVSLTSKEKEIIDKKTLFNEYDLTLKNNQIELEKTKLELENIEKEVAQSSSEELEQLKKNISDKESKLYQLNQTSKIENDKLLKLNNEKAVFEHSILTKKKDIQRKDILSKEIDKLEEDYLIASNVLEAFGPTGITNLIIQNVLDDLQIEANSILEKIKPGFQLEFSIEKTRSDGQQDDDLDILYFLNGKTRDYGQLSGAQKFYVMFSLKLGTAYILQRSTGSNFNMLLFDEVDQSYDKASIDAFSEIIKVFQKDFTILAITHNDRLKEKFNNIILVEQDQTGMSKAKLLTY